MIYKRNGVVDKSYSNQDVHLRYYYQNDDGSYDIHYMDGGNTVNKSYNVPVEDIKKKFQEWEESLNFPNFYSKQMIVKKEIYFK